MLRLRPRPTVLALLTLGVTACQDSFTAPPSGSPPPPSASVNGAPYYCSIRIATPGGIQESQRVLAFPPAAVHPQGAVMLYRYRRQPQPGTVTYSADCVIPRSMAALEHMNQGYQVPPELRSPKGKDKQGNEMTTQGCVSDGLCVLEPIVVTPVNEPDPWSGGGGGGGGGSTYPPPSPPPGGGDGFGDGGSKEPIEPVPSDASPCTRDANGNCVENLLSSTQWNALMSAISRIRTSPDYCAGAKQAMEALAAQGPDRFRVWDGADGNSTQAQVLSDQQGYYVVYHPSYVGSVVVAAHEGLHLYFNGSANPPSHEWIFQHDNDCVS